MLQFPQICHPRGIPWVSNFCGLVSRWGAQVGPGEPVHV